MTLRRSDGSERTMKPRHIIVATGVSGIPVWPNVLGLDTFKGAVMHSGQYTTGADWKGRKALVIGTGNSGHDVAQDLCASGVDTTIVQRNPTYIVSIREAQKVYRPTARACRSRIATCLPPRCLIRCCAAPTSSRPPRCARPTGAAEGAGGARLQAHLR